MTMSAVAVSTPIYVLIDNTLRIGPKVVALDTGVACAPIYGFSGKGPYDQFCSNSQQALKPYPLVKLYLQSQLDAADDSLKLVVLDATGPHDPYLHAATIEAVLEAQANGAATVVAAYGLIFDDVANAYRMQTDYDVEKSQLDETHASHPRLSDDQEPVSVADR